VAFKFLQPHPSADDCTLQERERECARERKEGRERESHFGKSLNLLNLNRAEVARDAKFGLIRHATTVVTVLGAAASTAWLDTPDNLQVHKQGIVQN